MNFKILIAVSILLLIGPKAYALEEGRNCEEQCQHDYSGCGSDPSDPCNKARQSCLDTCKSAQEEKEKQAQGDGVAQPQG